jgi:hypothetical protein
MYIYIYNEVEGVFLVVSLYHEAVRFGVPRACRRSRCHVMSCAVLFCHDVASTSPCVRAWSSFVGVLGRTVNEMLV